MKQDVLLKVVGIIKEHNADIAFPTQTLKLDPIQMAKIKKTAVFNSFNTQSPLNIEWALFYFGLTKPQKHRLFGKNHTRIERLNWTIVFPMTCSNCAICSAEMLCGSLITSQRTPSEHGGVVNEPLNR